jgi:hypothetical protein
MTKEQYFDMCEQLGTEPIDKDIPIELADFPIEVQEAFNIYRVLRDEWEFVAGSYLGKNLNSIFQVFDAYNIPKIDQAFYYNLINMIDSVRVEEMRKQTKKPAN